jgi:HEPN domain-containing protein
VLNLRFKEVKRFIRAAAAHRDAAKQLLATCPEAATSTRGHDVVYLSGYVVECALKALYLSRRPEREHVEIQKWFREQIKHNLEGLAREIQDAGVVIPRLQKEKLLRVVRPNWFTEMRYDIRAWSREDAERVWEAAELIFRWVSGD